LPRPCRRPWEVRLVDENIRPATRDDCEFCRSQTLHRCGIGLRADRPHRSDRYGC
jgi:hypothetical protein